LWLATKQDPKKASLPVNSIVIDNRPLYRLDFLLILYYFKHEDHTLLVYDAVVVGYRIRLP
jgi:hypothetical protein